MNWFRKYSVCVSCGTVFDPDKVESCEPWDSLCAEHRRPHIERERRRKVVVAWANRNWEKLEAQAIKEENEYGAVFNASQQQFLGQLAAARQSDARNLGAAITSLGGIGYFK